MFKPSHETFDSASEIMKFTLSATSDKCIRTARRDSRGEIGLSVDAAESSKLRFARRRRSAISFNAVFSNSSGPVVSFIL